jgi:hypothetical protein
MRSSLIAPIALTLAAYGQEGLKVQPQPKAPPPGQAETQRATPVVRRLESITWNPVTGELSWVVASWDSLEIGEQPTSRDTYSMAIDRAIMKFHGEDRKFDPVEAKHVRSLMDLLSVYAVESTVWWDQGKGEKTTDAPPSNKEPGNKEPGNKDATPPKTTPKSAPAVLQGAAGRQLASGACLSR